MNYLAKKSNLIFLIGVRQPHPHIPIVLSNIWTQSSQNTFHRKMKLLRGCILKRIMKEFPKIIIDKRAKLILKHLIRDLKRMPCTRIYYAIGYDLCAIIGCGQGYQLENVCGCCDSDKKCAISHRQEVVERLIRYILVEVIKLVGLIEFSGCHLMIGDFVGLKYINTNYAHASGTLYNLLEYHTNFGMFNTHLDDNATAIFDAIYADPIISKMDARQSNRVFYWAPNEPILLVAKYKNRIYVMDEMDSNALEKLLDAFGSKLSWSVERLKNLVKEVPISQWYVNIDRDSDSDDGENDEFATWASLVEIGNNDDYQA